MSEAAERSPVFDQPLTTLFGSGLRLSILKSFAGEPRTTGEVATEHQITRQNANYHLRQLESGGWLAIVGTEKRHTAREPVWAETTTAIDWQQILDSLNALAAKIPDDPSD